MWLWVTMENGENLTGGGRHEMDGDFDVPTIGGMRDAA